MERVLRVVFPLLSSPGHWRYPRLIFHSANVRVSYESTDLSTHALGRAIEMRNACMPLPHPPVDVSGRRPRPYTRYTRRSINYGSHTGKRIRNTFLGNQYPRPPTVHCALHGPPLKNYRLELY